MKAIHNYCREMGTHRVDVVTLSKIEKMKAIHNIMVMLVILRRML